MTDIRLNKQTQLYHQVADQAVEIIRSRGLRPHDPVPSEGELAKLFGVSRMTSKLALQKLAEQGLVYRLPRRGTFLAERHEEERHEEAAFQNADTVSNMQRPNKQIALIMPHLSDYTGRIIAATEAEVQKYDCDLILRMTRNSEDEDQCLKRLAEGGITGIILFPQGRKTCSDQVLRLKLRKLPLVIIDRIFHEVEIDCVYHDHYSGSYQMTQYLIEKGHREIGYTSNAVDHITSREERYRGYIQALLDHKISVKNQNIHFRSEACDTRRISERDAEQEQFIGGNPKMTAVVCGDDHVAISTMYTALHMNIPVPDQLSIVGFSDIQLASFIPIPLTTVRQDTEKLARSAVNLMMKRLERSNENPIAIKINTSIVERKSVLARV